MSSSEVSYLLFDIESIADGDLVSRIRFPDEELSPSEAVTRYQQELLERFGTEFIPYTFHVPVAIVVIKIKEDFSFDDIVTMDAPEYRPHKVVEMFWKGWRHYKMPTLISFNGRTFDIPLLELAAFRYGISIPDWFNFHEKSFDQRRNRYNQKAHFDLQEVLTNFGATRLTGGLNLVANMLGRPGKMEIAGHMVQEMYDRGELAQINDYCRCDVLDTYFVFLRTGVMTGTITRDREKELIESANKWLEEKSGEFPIYSEYLKKCRPWADPWQ
ncbi:MAG: 3'-5' exonuclease [Planctomycetota bacterium]